MRRSRGVGGGEESVAPRGGGDGLGKSLARRIGVAELAEGAWWSSGWRAGRRWLRCDAGRVGVRGIVESSCEAWELCCVLRQAQNCQRREKGENRVGDGCLRRRGAWSADRGGWSASHVGAGPAGASFAFGGGKSESPTSSVPRQRAFRVWLALVPWEASGARGWSKSKSSPRVIQNSKARGIRRPRLPLLALAVKTMTQTSLVS